MLGVMQIINFCCNNFTFNKYDLEYLAYQLIKKHSIETVKTMDKKTVKDEINKISGGNIYGSNKRT